MPLSAVVISIRRKVEPALRTLTLWRSMIAAKRRSLPARPACMLAAAAFNERRGIARARARTTGMPLIGDHQVFCAAFVELHAFVRERLRERRERSKTRGSKATGMISTATQSTWTRPAPGWGTGWWQVGWRRARTRRRRTWAWRVWTRRRQWRLLMPTSASTPARASWCRPTLGNAASIHLNSWLGGHKLMDRNRIIENLRQIALQQFHRHEGRNTCCSEDGRRG